MLIIRAPEVLHAASVCLSSRAGRPTDRFDRPTDRPTDRFDRSIGADGPPLKSSPRHCNRPGYIDNDLFFDQKCSQGDSYIVEGKEKEKREGGRGREGEGEGGGDREEEALSSAIIVMASVGMAQWAKTFINSPTGPMTTHFWGPVANWGFVIAVRPSRLCVLTSSLQLSMACPDCARIIYAASRVARRGAG